MGMNLIHWKVTPLTRTSMTSLSRLSLPQCPPLHLLSSGRVNSVPIAITAVAVELLPPMGMFILPLLITIIITTPLSTCILTDTLVSMQMDEMDCMACHT